MTTNHPTNDEIREKWEVLKKAASSVFRCRRDELPQHLSEQDDDALLLIQQNDQEMEVVVVPQQLA